MFLVLHPEVRMVDRDQLVSACWPTELQRRAKNCSFSLQQHPLLIVAFCIQCIVRLHMLTPSFSSKLLNNCAHPAGKRAAATPALSFFIILLPSTANCLNTELPPSRATRRRRGPASRFAVAGDPCFFCMTVCVSAHAPGLVPGVPPSTEHVLW